MKKTILTVLAFAGVLSSSLFAALPPLAQNAKEIEAIMTSPELTTKLATGSPIKLIKHIRDSSYLVVTYKQKMIVDVVYGSSGSQNQGVGPQKFTLFFHDAIDFTHDDDNEA